MSKISSVFIFLVFPLLTLNQDSLLIEKIKRITPEIIRKYDIPGIAVGIISGGELSWTGGFGKKDLNSNENIDSRTTFQIASVSKVFTACCILKLYEQGLINLDDPLNKYIKSWQLPDGEYPASEVTIRRILSHSAGLSRHGYSGYLPDEKIPDLLNSIKNGPNGLPDVRIISEPGTSFRYSGGGFTLLELLIQEVSGKSIYEFMREEVFNPLGLKHTAFGKDPLISGELSTPYDLYSNERPFRFFAGQACCGISTDITDLTLFVASLMETSDNNAGKLLSGETIQMMREPLVPVKGSMGINGDSMALSLFIENINKDIFLIAHGGSNKGYRARFVASPATGDGIVLLSNSDMGLMAIDGLIKLWSEHLFDKALKINRFYRSMRVFALFLIMIINLFVFGYFILMFLKRKIKFREFKFHKKRIAGLNFITTSATLLVMAFFLYYWRMYLGWAIRYIVPEHSGMIYYSIILLGIFLLTISLFKFIKKSEK